MAHSLGIVPCVRKASVISLQLKAHFLPFSRHNSHLRGQPQTLFILPSGLHCVQAQTAISWEPITKRGLHAATIFVRNNEAGSVAGPIGKVRAVLQSVTDSSQKIRRVLDLVSFNASAATAECAP
jgi:hypothetical protein